LAALLVGCQVPQPTPRATDAPLTPLTSAAPSETVAASDTFRYAIAEPAAIVPPAATELNGLVVVDAVFDSLTAYDASLRVVPAAAESWSATAPDEWTFTLREVATFHNGSPVTAADFKFSWEQAVRLNLAGYHLRDVQGYDALRTKKAGELTGVTAVDDRTLRVRLVGPRADFPAVVAHPALGPVPRGAWRSDGAALLQRPIGNGPFRMDGSWAHNEFIRVARFDGWRNGLAPPAVEEVVFPISDPDTAYLAFQQGRRDFSPLPTGALAEASRQFPASSDDGYHGPGVLIGPTPVLYFLGFNVTQPPFDDVEVRRAVSMAIDREALRAETLEGNVSVGRSAVPPPIPGARDQACGACEHRPAEARRIFAERGITELELWFNRNGGHDQIAQRISQDLAATGVGLRLRSEPPSSDGSFGAYLDILSSGEAGMFRFGWSAEYPTMDAALSPLFDSRATPPSGGQNFMRYTNPEVDPLLDQARATTDEGRRRLLYQRVEDLALARDQAIAPLFTYHHRFVAAERVENLYLSPFGLVNLAEITLRPAK
jgi:peptide/nickel transport system substrate-binding protein/oligopeptide transport system substrate-binding protein